MGSSLAFSLKEDPVRCAKVCNESWVILVPTCYLRFGFHLKTYLHCQFNDSFPSKSSLVPVLVLGAKEYSEEAINI